MLTERDVEIRKAIIDSGGVLKIAAENLDVSYDHLRNRLRAKKHQAWWRRTKVKFIRERKRARERRWYAGAVARSARLENVKD